MQTDPSTIQSQLGLSERFRSWLDQLAVSGPADDLVLPDDGAVDSILLNLGVEELDRQACLEGRPDPENHPELWWVLCHAHRDLVTKMGRTLAGGWYTGWPSFPENSGIVSQQLFVWAFLAAAPNVQGFHRERGIPDDVSQVTLSTLSMEISSRRDVSDQPGVNGGWMLPLVFQGASYRLGRHAFDRYGGSLNVHVPAGEPLYPAVSQASFEWASEFFPHHFPEDRIETFVCHSWLMDDQWAEYLPATSNIIRFQRRFTVELDESGEPGDNDILQFVFHRKSDGPSPSNELLNSLPQDTTLQRTYVSHLRNGGHWWTRNGRMTFKG